MRLAGFDSPACVQRRHAHMNTNLQALARSIVKRESAFGLSRIATLARTPSVYQGSVDPKVSYEALYPLIQAEAQALLNAAAE